MEEQWIRAYSLPHSHGSWLVRFLIRMVLPTVGHLKSTNNQDDASQTRPQAYLTEAIPQLTVSFRMTIGWIKLAIEAN